MNKPKPDETLKGYLLREYGCGFNDSIHNHVMNHNGQMCIRMPDNIDKWFLPVKDLPKKYQKLLKEITE